DIVDVPDVVDIVDVPDVVDIVDAGTWDIIDETSDPYEHFIEFNKPCFAAHWPWVYYSKSKYVYVGPDQDIFRIRYRYNLETHLEENLGESTLACWGRDIYVHPVDGRSYTPVRSIRIHEYLSEARWWEFGPWMFEVTEMATGATQLWTPEVPFMSEDCLAHDESQSGTVFEVLRMSEDGRQMVLRCWGDRSDLYRVDLQTGEVDYFSRGSLEPDGYDTALPRGYFFQDDGSDFVNGVFIFHDGNGFVRDFRIWNWRTGELVWNLIHSDLTSLSNPTSDGWFFYGLDLSGGVHPYDWQLFGENFLTGETLRPPQVMMQVVAAHAGLWGRPDLVMLLARDFGDPGGYARYFLFLWDRSTGVTRQVTTVDWHGWQGTLVNGQDPASTVIYRDSASGDFPNVYCKDLVEAGIMDDQGNLLPVSSQQQ
ncbi:hypothetical protein KKC22_15310, partial [Myxococcota bacterium]|nr:hypothetical protein [Myxococcota bacterium]